MASGEDNMVSMIETSVHRSDNMNTEKKASVPEKGTENQLKPMDSINSTNKVNMLQNIDLYIRV